ncbi:MAG TPA: glycerate kinase, partial [Chloroflexia bacterium]|nr:glycerate kinase [Chloroflexia bacterium]
FRGGSYRAAVMDVLGAALKAADPYLAVRSALESHPGLSESNGSKGKGRVFVLGAGKAGAAMARAAEETFGERIAEGLVVVKDGHTDTGGEPLRQVQLTEASHPLPDSRGIEAAGRLLDIGARAGEDDLVVCLISGGGSALLTSPAEGIGLEEVQATTRLLLRSGATINELNAVRKHLSRVAGGLLARAAAPAQVVSLILSDVTGSPLDVIASGPTAPDTTTFGHALDVLGRYGLTTEVPPVVLSRLQSGAAGEIEETPKPGDALFSRVVNIIVASNVIAVEAAEMRAREIGLATAIVSTFVEGEAREVGNVLAAAAREVALFDRPVARPGCLLFGGETTVTVRGEGVGGRNTELALSAAQGLEGLGNGTLVASLATDGGDGCAPCGGGLVDGTTIDRGRALGLDPFAYLAANDSFSYLDRTGDTIKIGPTGTNVNDVMAVFVF